MLLQMTGRNLTVPPALEAEEWPPMPATEQERHEISET